MNRHPVTGVSDRLELLPSASTRQARSAPRPLPRFPRGPEVRVRQLAGAIYLSCPALAEAARLPTRRELIDRLFSIANLRALRLDPVRGSAWLTFESGAVSRSEALEALTAALRARTPPRLALPCEELLLTLWAAQPFSVWRAPRGLTLWSIEEVDAGRFRLSHPLLRVPPVCERILDAIVAVAGVTRQSASLLHPETIDVWCQPHRIGAGVLLEIVERALADYPSLTAGRRPALRGSLVAANLALAPISDFLFPPLGLANAALVWLLNAEHIAGAREAVRERRANLEVLYLCVGACTLLTFHFFAAALMYAALELWPRVVRRLRQEGQRQFLARYRRCPPCVWSERGGTLLETALADVPAGEVVVLREGDTIPGDGVVLQGRAEVRESWITGAAGSVEKRPDDKLYASTELVGGEIRARLDVMGERTVAARRAAWFAEALRPPPVKVKAENLADSMVLPALIFGAAALSRGGISMTKAVLRPDYFSGPALAEELSALLTLIHAAEAGFHLSDQTLLDRLATADCWIFDDGVPWTSTLPNGAGFAERLRSEGVPEVHFLSRQPEAEAARSAHSLGFDTWRGNVSTESKISFIEQRQFLGESVVYFGDCEREPAVSARADVAISVLHGEPFQTSRAPIALLLPELARCLALHSLCEARTTSVSTAFSTSFVPNAAAAVGAIFLNFSVLTSVILTNLGTLASYYRWRRKLQSVQ